MLRRDFIKLGIASLPLAACDAVRDHMTPKPPITVRRPGMQAGHFLRDTNTWPAPTGDIHCDVAIIGSGAAGITAAWKLAREGYRNIVLLSGPEPFGNAASGGSGDLRHPTGAHYLPLPTVESSHVREILQATHVLQGAADAPRPHYDEMALVHPARERIREGTTTKGKWQDEFLPAEGMDTDQRERFIQLIAELRHRKGEDGRPLFAIPMAHSSADAKWRALDSQNFKDWLLTQGFTDGRLHWYADYCCRDDYGAGSHLVSAWAGLHYFASRTGEAANADSDTLLTWPEGLHKPLTKMLDQIPFGDESKHPRHIKGFALRIDEKGRGKDSRQEVLALHGDLKSSFRIHARRTVVAAPLHVAAHIVPHIHDFGFSAREHLPQQSNWIVANFVMRRFPQEHNSTLAWDNVLREGRGLGYVVSTHQMIRVAKPERTVFTAYTALPADDLLAQRRWLSRASDAEIIAVAAADLELAYGKAFWPLVESAEITLRGHAMSIPRPGFLNNPGIAALRELDGGIRFAHSDLSGFSIFEEASWWGYQAALGILGKA